MFSRRRAQDLAIVAAVAVLGAVALADALRDGTTTEEARDGRAATAAATDEGEASAPRLPGGAASGLLAFTAPGGCELRAIDLRSGRMLDLPRLETSCVLDAPRVGSRVAYSTVSDEGFATRRFSILDLENPRASFGEYEGYFPIAFVPIAWGPDGSTLAWCDSLRSGFELWRSQRPKRLDHCPRAYDPSGVTAYVNDRQIVIDGRPLLRADGHIWRFAWGVDGSLAVLVNGRVDRYEGGRLVGAASVPPEPPPIIADLAPDNCAVLSVGGGVIRLVDLGCFQGQAPRMFNGLYADWSPNGKWIVVAEPDAVVFHRVVGREASVRWNVVAGQLAWLSG
jgi:hypothetical protein